MACVDASAAGRADPHGTAQGAAPRAAKEEASLMERLAFFLREARVEDERAGRPVLVLHDAMPIDAALAALAEHEVLAAPVLTGRPEVPRDPVPRSEHAAGDALGFVAVRDIVFSFLDALPADSVALRGDAPLSERAAALADAGTRFSTKTVADVRPFTSDGSFIHVGRKSRLSLWEVAFSSFLHPERRPPSASGAEARMHHRAALFNSQHELTHVVSQTDVVRSLLRGRSAGSPHVARSLGVRMLDVPGLCSTSIVSVTADTSALDAIALMRRHGLSAVPIVAAGSGVLRGTFGLGALRRVMAEQFAALALPVGDFLSLPAGSAEGSANGESETGSLTPAARDVPPAALDFVRSASRSLQQQQSTMSGPRYLTSEATLSDYLDIIAARKTHRAFFVDEAQRPIAVASLTDLLHAIDGERSARATAP